jgi:lambda repressor-like predicted transcriptional regulator
MGTELRDRTETTITLNGHKVLAALGARGLSAAAFAELAHVSPNTMTRVLAGQPISTKSARKIAEALAKAPVVVGLSELLAS